MAANLKRLPTVTPGEVDICTMAATVASLTSQVEALSKKFESLNNVNGNNVNQRLEVLEAKITQVSFPASINVPDEKGAGTPINGNSDSTSFAAIVKKPMAVRLKGSASQCALKAVPRLPTPKLLKAFVGRMDINTTEEELASFLTDAGLEVVSCRKLKPPNGKTFTTAEFYVACVETEVSQELFYSESIWPDGAELRDWYTRS